MLGQDFYKSKWIIPKTLWCPHSWENGLSYMEAYVFLNHSANKVQLFSWFDNTVNPFGLAGINKDIRNFLLCRQNWHITFCSKQYPNEY